MSIKNVTLASILGTALLTVGCSADSTPPEPDRIAELPVVASLLSQDERALYVAGAGAFWIDKASHVMVPLVLPSVVVKAIAVDAAYFYWIDDGGLLQRVLKSGGAAESLASTGASAAAIPLAVTDDAVCWAAGGIRCWAKADSSLHVVLESDHDPADLITDQNRLFWADRVSGEIWKADGLGAPPSVLAHAIEPTRITARGDQLYVLARVGLIAVERVILAVNVSSGQISPIVDSLPNATAIAVDAENLYWVQDAPPSRPSIQRVSLSGGVPEKYTDAYVNAFAVDESSVYWLSWVVPPDEIGKFNRLVFAAGK